MNARLNYREISRLSDPWKTIALGDGNDSTGATDARYRWLSIPTYAFADGHVKWFRAEN